MFQYSTNSHHSLENHIEVDLSTVCNPRKRRGRPCATERRHNDLIQAKFTSLVHHNNDEVTKNKVMPFIIKRQRRSRANDRERTRMETLNTAMAVLKQHLPVELFTNSEMNDTFSSSSLKSTKNSNSIKSKITKIDTLRIASEYIARLKSILEEADEQQKSFSSNSQSPPVYACATTGSSIVVNGGFGSCSSDESMMYRNVNDKRQVGGWHGYTGNVYHQHIDNYELGGIANSSYYGYRSNMFNY